MQHDNRDRDKDRRPGEILNGSLVVRGEDFIEIELGRTRPESIDVRFKDLPDNVPCNPRRDVLDYKIFHTRGRYMLFITYKVSGVREVVWTIIF